MRWAVFVAAIGVAQTSALADTVHLRDGRELSGYVVDESQRSILIVGADGAPVSVPRSQVEWIAYIGDAGARAALRRSLLPEVPVPSTKRAAAPGNRGYLGSVATPPPSRSSDRSSDR